MSAFGQNTGYVDELYARYLANPEAVSEAWREFFADWRPPVERSVRTPPAPAGTASEAPAGAQPLVGIAARIAENMTASLAVPTATSARTIAVKLLEENRRLINQHQAAMASSRLSFTHLVAWAIVRALERHPAMNAGYAEVDGQPHRVPRPVINLGIAVDVLRKDERVLLVPNLKDASALDVPTFVRAYDELVGRARDGRLAVEDFQDTTVTITNPGTVGTSLSVPRLMAGQAAILGVGAIGYPPEYAGMPPSAIAQLGLSKVMTLTSTYDHRVIQGAESGAFLATIDRLLSGADGFYGRVFAELGVPHEPLQADEDRHPGWLSDSSHLEAIRRQASVLQLIRVYRVRGHLYAELDPLGPVPTPEIHPELELSHYGLSLWDLDREFLAGGLAGKHGLVTLREILETLRDTYCGHVGVEFMHVPEPEIRGWLQDRMEATHNREPLPPAAQRRILERLTGAAAFERFLHTNYVGHKRFSLEGAETLIPMLDALLVDGAAAGVEQVVLGMAHRGRLNVLANVIGKSYGQIFREFEGDIDPATSHGSGDVKYHLGASGTFRAPDGRSVSITMASNPSHLEAVDPVVEGMTRARQDALGPTGRDRVLPVLIHGDAAFAGQGVVAETLNLSELRGYRCGGTVHIVVNNQIGFTTGPEDARSSPHPTDVAKTVRAPIFHVNADFPEDAVRVVRLALAYRQRFRRDVVVDLVCYRRWGHNEGDDPSYTHPLLYAAIERHRSIRMLYTEQLLRRGDLTPEQAERSLEGFRACLQHALDDVHDSRREPPGSPPDRGGEPVLGEATPGPPTAVPRERLESVLGGLERLPEGFEVHPKLARQLGRRRERFEGDRIDWALAETLAFGTLVLEGTPVRLSGEDSARGTFSQRHATLADQRTGATVTPLASLAPGQAPFAVYDSLLSEFAVLGFEYGYSVERPEALVLWEAQFGDFANGGQVIVDQFLVSAEEKWAQSSGLVLLLPHGYEGQGPEHSSARLERFLQLCARGNMRVAVPSTPAQYFHLLRRQARDRARKPLIVLTPKSLLRLPAAVSAAGDLTDGAFQEVMAPAMASSTRRLLLCSGKIAYELEEARAAAGGADVAIVRLEQLYPFPGELVGSVLAAAPAAECLWVQEEPRTMGAFAFVEQRLAPLLGGRTLRYVGRPPSPSPATGSNRRHLEEQRRVVAEALGTEVPAAGATQQFEAAHARVRDV